jgi:hypothetical protein
MGKGDISDITRAVGHEKAKAGINEQLGTILASAANPTSDPQNFTKDLDNMNAGSAEAGTDNGSELLENHRIENQRIELPGDNRYTGRYAAELGPILAPHDFFRRFDKCVIPKRNEKGNVRLEEISAHEFRTLIEGHSKPFRWSRGHKEREKIWHTMALDTAHMTLVNRKFLETLRPVESFNLVRLPARYDEAIRPLPLGYCPIHRAYTTANCPEYALNMPLEEARKFFNSLLGEFPFVGGEEGKTQAQNTVLAAALTLFCRHLFGPDVIRPNFAASANAEGAGKTLLLKIAIIAVLGCAPVGTRPKDEDEMRKLIAAAATAGSPVFFLDNAKGHVSSPSLEALTTSPTIEFRFLGQTKLLQERHGLTIFITSNNATSSPDLRRRTFQIELFLQEIQPETRLIKKPLDDERLVELRPTILAALWSLVDHWTQKGQPPPKYPHQSFLAWSKVVSGILESCEYPAPCHTVSGGSHGDRDLLCMIALVAQMTPALHYTFTMLVSLAREQRLFGWILGDAPDPEPKTDQDDHDDLKSPDEDSDPSKAPDELDRKARRKFSYILNRFLDRIFPHNDKPVRFQLMTKTARKFYGIQPLNNP